MGVGEFPGKLLHRSRAAVVGLGLLAMAPSATNYEIVNPLKPVGLEAVVSEAHLNRFTPETAEEFLSSRTIDKSRRTRPTPKRKATELVIYHGTEHGPSGSCVHGDLPTLMNLRGDPKVHMLVCRNGDTYRIQSPDARVIGGGVSLWKGREDVSDVAYQVEFETSTYKTSDLTPVQREIGCAISTWLKDRYKLSDSAFVSHGQVAYGEYAGEKVRERKRDGFFDFDDDLCVYNRHIGDPDAEAGRLKGSPFQSRYYELERKDSLRAIERLNLVYDFPTREFGDTAAFVLDEEVTPFVVSAHEYDSKHTKYRLPDGHWVNGKQLNSCYRNPKIRQKECHGAYWGNVPDSTLMFTYVSSLNQTRLKKAVDKAIAAER